MATHVPHPLAARTWQIASLALLLLPAIAFLWLAWQRASTAQFANDVTAARGPEDWNTYKLYALSILHGDFLLRLVQQPYARPGGFLYNYVLAGLFGLLGERTAPIYVVQAGLLGLAAALYALAYRPMLPRALGLLYFAAVSVCLYFDWYANYTFRLLSENLLLVLLPLSLALVFWAERRGSRRLALLSGLALGLALLTRPNLLIVAVGLSLLWAAYRWRTARGAVAIFTVAWIVVFGLMALRNYLVVQQLSLAAVTDTRDWLAPNHSGVDKYLVTDPFASPARTLELYVRRALFMVGYLPALEPDFRVRPHWLLVWLASTAYGLWCLAARRRVPFWEAATFLTVAAYFGPLLLAASITNYGFRMLVPGVPLLVLLSLRLAQHLARHLFARPTARRLSVQSSGVIRSTLLGPANHQ